MTDRPMSEMIRNQRPTTLHTDATAADACSHMDERRTGAVLVTDADNHLVGIFTGRDAVRMRAQQCTPECPLEAVMTRSPDVVPPGHTAMDALRPMQDGGFRHLPVVVRGRVVGPVSWGDSHPSEHNRLDIETDYWERI